MAMTTTTIHFPPSPSLDDFKVLEEEKGEGRKEEKGKWREDGDDYSDYPFSPLTLPR